MPLLPGSAPTLVRPDGPSLRVVPVAASVVLAGPLTGPPHPGRVLLTGPWAAYVATTAGAFALVASGAVAPSTALVLGVGVRPDDVLRDGDEVEVGAGGVLVPARGPGPGTALRVSRWWEPTRVRTGPLVASALSALRGAVARKEEPLPVEVVHARSAGRRAAAHLVAGEPALAAAHLESVLGIGPGTTPSGDDVAVGVLLAGHALLTDDGRRAGLRRAAAAVGAAAPARTGTVSVTMLAEARRGRGPAVVVKAVNALVGHGDARTAADELLDLGHHSGADLACGVLALADAVRDAGRRR